MFPIDRYYLSDAFYHKISLNVLENLDISKLTRKDMTHGVISIDSSLLNSMRNGKNVNFRGRKMGITSPSP